MPKIIDIVMPMCNLIEYSHNYSKIFGILWQYYKDDPNDKNNLADSKSFKSKVKIRGSILLLMGIRKMLK